MSQLIQSGGVQTVTQLNQIVYLDFDGEYTSYNGEILNVDGVVVEDSKLTEERIAEIVAALNEKYIFAGVKFVTERPIDGEYSTVYVGKTDDFDQYGNFAGLAETIDKGNANKSDNAFVMLDSTASNAQIVDTISHETDHLLGTLDHGGEGLEEYTSFNPNCFKYFNNTYTGGLNSGLSLWHNAINYSSSFQQALGINSSTFYYYDKAQNVTINSGGSMYISRDGVANNTTINGGFMQIHAGGTANNTTVNSGELFVDGGSANGIIISGGALTLWEDITNVSDIYFLAGELNISNTSFTASSDTKMFISCSHIYTRAAGSGKTATTIIENGNMLSADCVISNVIFTGGSMAVTSIGDDANLKVVSNGAWHTGGSATVLIGDNATFYNGYIRNECAMNGICTIKIGNKANFINTGIMNSYPASGGVCEIYVGNSAIFSGGGIRNNYRGKNDLFEIGDDALFLEISSGAICIEGKNVTIGDNATFSKNGRAIMANGNTQLSIGNGCTFSENMINGGGIISAWSGDVTIGNSATFIKNIGGAIEVYGGSLVIGDNPEFTSNVRQGPEMGGAIGLLNTLSSRSLEIGDNAIFAANKAYIYGGAICTGAEETKIGDNAIFSGNVVSAIESRGSLAGGGAIYTQGSELIIGSNAKFINNSVVANGKIDNVRQGGGAILNLYGIISIGDGAVFSGNIASSGGAIHNRAAWGTKYNSTTGEWDIPIERRGKIILGDATFATYTDTVYNIGDMVLNGDVSFGGNVTLAEYKNSDGTAVGTLQNNGNIDFNVAARLEDDGLLLNNWELVSGDGTYSVTIDNKQVGGTYQLIGNAANFDKTITVRSESGSTLGELSLDMEEPLKLKNMSLILDLDEETNIISLVVDSEYSEGTSRERQETKIELPTNAFAGMSYGDYTLTQAPDWLSIDPNTGKFSGTTGKITGTATGYGTTEVVITGKKGDETKEHTMEVVVVPEHIKGDSVVSHEDGANMTDLVAEAVSKRKEHPASGLGVEVELKEVNWEYCGLDLEATDMSLTIDVTETDYEVKLQGKLGLSIFDSGKKADERAGLVVDLSGENYVKITTPHDFGSVKFDIVGELTFSNLTLADGFFLKEGVITVDTEEDKWSGTADIEFTYFDKALHAEYIVIDKQVDTLTVDVSGLDIAVGTTGFFLESVNGGVKNLSDSDNKPSELVGGVELYYGKEVTIGGNTYSLATLDLDATVTNASLTGTGNVEILGGILTGDVSATVNWQKGSLAASGSLTFANLATVQGAFEIDKTGNISVTASGIVDFSKYGLNFQASSNIYLQFVNDGVSSNDFYAAWTTVSLFGWEESMGIRLNLDGSWELLGTDSIPGSGADSSADVPDGMVGYDESGTVYQSWDLTSVSGVVLLTAKWESGSAEVVLKDSAGNTYDLAAINKRSDMKIVEELSGEKSVVIALKDSVSGVWSMEVSNGTNADVSASTLTSGETVGAPALNVKLGADRTVAIDWTCGTVPENATLSIYYDTDGTGHDGILISSITPESAGGTVEWTVPEAVGGNLRFYAVLTSPETIPAIGSYTGAVSIAAERQLATVNSSDWTYVGNESYVQSAVVSSGGVLEANGGLLTGTTRITSGGTLILSNAELTGTVNLAGDLEIKGTNNASGANINIDLSGKEPDDTYIVDGIKNLTGASWTVSLASDHEAGSYYLARDAEGFNQTVTVNVDNKAVGTLTVNGDKLKVDGISYSLVLEDDGKLYLSTVEGPELTITGNPTTWTNKNVVLTATTDASAGTIEYSVNNKDWIKGSTAVVDGNRTIYWRITDENGKVLTTETVVVNRIDKTAPTVTVKANPVGSNIVLSATANESGSTIEYSVNKQTWVKGSTAVVDGNRTIYWRATDVVGNVSEVTSYQVNDFVPVSSAKVSSGLKIGSGKIMKVLSGGTANQTTVSSGGVMNVAGKANYTSAFKGAAVNVSKGGSMYGVNLYSGANLNISSGGSVNTLFYNGAAVADVSSGGQLSNTTVNSDGLLNVLSGAKVTSVTLKNGGTMNYYGGTAYNVDLLYGGIMNIQSGAVRQGQIADKGTINVFYGGTASGCITKSGGMMNVHSGGSADDTKLMTNGSMYIHSGGTATDTVTSYGARVYVSGGKIYNTNMQRGTITSVYQGGIASLNKVDYGSYLMVDSGATTYDTVVSSGGGLTVMSGAVAEDTVNYGTLTCNNGGTLLGETVIHGRANLAGNAVVTDETSITFDVSGREVSAMQESYYEAMLNSYYVAREADMTISVSADQASGSYILANWALEAKKGTFTLEVDGTEVGTFSTSESLTYDGKTYSLYCFDDSTNSKALTLKVCDAAATDAWTDLGSGDFDGDGIEESLVSDGTNLYAASEDLWLGNLSATEEIASITDYNNDGTDDLLIHNTATDQMTAWLVKDGSTFSTLAIA
ncbi:MAG: AIDA repeat-containing protein [Lentisphaeria bacterium]|nr:AIDA repeat-containing protein [Lentisphaeria bacterium]